MVRKAKTPKFNVFNSCEFCFGQRQEHDGTWQKYFNDPSKHLTVEVGCGRAELTLELARRYPEQNFIGVDRKSDRMWRPALTSIEEKLNNTAFIQTDSRKLDEFFPDSSVDVIWVTFPDPYPRVKHEKNRLVNDRFLNLYKNMLKPDGVVRFKTDDKALFDYFLNDILPKRKDINLSTVDLDLHGSDLPEDYKIITTYEARWIAEGRTVYFAEFNFN